MNFHSSYLSLAILFIAAVTLPVHAQARSASSAGWSEWESLNPEGEEFTVLMPKGYSSESGKFPYHKMELTGRLYLSSLPGGPVVAVASFSGIKSAAGSEFERFNSYIDAFKDWFPGKVRAKDAIAKLTPIGTRMFHGYSGREYKLTIADLNGIAQAYATRKRFYVVVSLNTKKDDALREKFLSSFLLPDKPVEQKQVATTDNNITATEAPPTPPTPETKKVESAPTTGNSSVGEDNTEYGSANTAANPSANSPNQADSTLPKQKRAPISGGMLNGKAIYLPLPEVPAGQASGVVMVQVLIDEEGTVVEARAISGPAQLQAAAVNAARLARFTPTMLMGEPVKVTGTLSYNFGRAN